MLRQILSIWRPAQDHIHPNTSRFFEGWYYKLANATGDRVYAVIPGVYIGQNHASSHAFIQIIDSHNHRSHYFSYDLSHFSSDPYQFSIHIGKNYFSLARMALHIHRDGLEIEGAVTMVQPKPWPVSPLSPGVMGWYGLLPFLECYHGVLSIDHQLEGGISFQGEDVLFSGGKGYIEKNWGHRFPTTWIWMQANHFPEKNTSFMMSLARIPFLGMTFPGLIAGLWFKGRLYRFATYLGSKIENAHFKADELQLTLCSKDHQITIQAVMKDPVPLMAPSDKGMAVPMAESLSSQIDLTFYEINRPSAPLFAGRSDHAGLEMAGDLHQLLPEH